MRPDTSTTPATPKQVGFIRSLTAKADGLDHTDVLARIKRLHGHDRLEDLTRGQASALIDTLRRWKAVDA